MAAESSRAGAVRMLQRCVCFRGIAEADRRTLSLDRDVNDPQRTLSVAAPVYSFWPKMTEH
jgi:hypothetical protein